MGFKDLTGQRFGRLVALYRAEDKIAPCGQHKTMWHCVCDCGNYVDVRSEQLTKGRCISCGCYHKDRASETHTIHGDTGSRLFAIWNSIKQRCYNQNNSRFKYYGAKGITMCDEWKDDYSRFKDWAYSNGYDETLPRGECTIDRIDLNGDYCPDNCRWVSNLVQANNKSNNHYLTYNGKTQSIADWARETGLTSSAISLRIVRRGWPVEDALTTPLGKRRDKSA